jgi:hypothetical protein
VIRIKKNIFLTVFLSAICCQVFSQTNLNTDGKGTIYARVVDSLSMKPIGFAVVSVFEKDSTMPVVQSLTSDSGEFWIKDIPYGKYKIVISFFGYHSFVKKDIEITKENPDLNLGTVVLAGDLHILQGTEIVAQRDVIETQIDKVIYHADKDVTSSAGTAIDVLKKVPGVSVDINVNI